MKKYCKKLMEASSYRKTMYLYILGAVTVTYIFLFVTFFSITNSLQKRNLDTSRQLLQQLVSSTDQIKADVENLLSIISTDSRINSVNQDGVHNRSKTYLLYLRLKDWKAMYSYVENISVLNIENGVCIHTLGEAAVAKETISSATYMTENRMDVMQRTIRPMNQEIGVLSFISYFPYQKSAIVVDVNSEHFQYSIDTDLAQARVAYILDAEGKPITEVENEMVNGVPVQDYLAELIKNHEISETPMVYNDTRKQKMVFLCKSPSTGWYLGDIQDYTVYYKELHTVITGFLILVIVFAVLMIVTTVLFIRKIQQPLLKIVQRASGVAGIEASYRESDLLHLDKAIARIGMEKNVYENFIHAQFLKSIMLGYSMPFLIPHEKLAELKKAYEAMYYAVMLIKIQPKAVSTEKSRREDYSLYRFVVCNLIDEIFGKCYRCKATELRENTVGILFFMEESELSDEYNNCFHRMQELAKEKLDLLLSGSVGNVVDCQNEIYESCQKAEQYEKVTNLIGKKELIDSNQMCNANYQEKNQKLVESMIEYTKMNYTNPNLSLKSIALIFGLSTSYLGKIFKSIQEMSYSAYLTSYRLEESRVLLMESTKSINEIAGGLGFTNTTYFTTIFKNQYGLTPTAFRNERNMAKVTEKS